MSDAAISAITVGAVLLGIYALSAPLIANIEFDVPTPMRNRNRPVVVNLAILLALWWPTLLLALPLVALVRLCLPSSIVNTYVRGVIE